MSITYARGVTLNIGDFESVRMDLSASAELDDGESFEDAYAALKEKIDATLRQETARVRERTKKIRG